jgi:hypothetical protein
LQQPRRKIVRGEFGRRHRREGVERPGRKMTGQPNWFSPETIACRRSA